MAARSFTFSSFAVRWFLAVLLVLATFNPAGFSYYHWLTEVESGSLAVKALVGVAFAIGYVIFLRATFRSIGAPGLVLVLALLGAIVWVLIDFGLLDISDSSVLAYVLLLVMATVMAVGLSWSHVRRRLSGQVDMDDVDE